MTTWSNEKKIDEAEDCSYCGVDRATFILTDELFGVIKTLCADVKTEWQALLIGEERDNNVVYMHDYYIPKQTVTTGNVINDECFTVDRIKEMGIVGGIHSHGEMGVFFSKTDHDCTNTSPIKNNIVVNNKNEFLGTKALTLPCGMIKFLDAVVTREMPVVIPAKTVKGVKHIEQKAYTYYEPADTFGYGMGAYKPNNFCNAGFSDSDYLRYGESHIKGTRKKHAFQIEEEGLT